jgi:hypothetical protein
LLTARRSEPWRPLCARGRIVALGATGVEARYGIAGRGVLPPIGGHSAVRPDRGREEPGVRQAEDLPARIRRLARAAGEPQRFTRLLEEVRADQVRERNLLELIDRKGW